MSANNIIVELDELKKGKLPINKIIHGNALETLKKLPSESIDCVVTSPPYWSLRDYTDEANTKWPDGYVGQLGLEPTPEMFVDHLIMIFREIKRVLKPYGNVFVVINDTYSGNLNWTSRFMTEETINKWMPNKKLIRKAKAPKKSLCLVPEMFAMRMVYELGFILRNKIIWAKKLHDYKNRRTIGTALPCSVKDRLCNNWEYVYHFVKNPKYYYNLDAVRVPHKTASVERLKRAERLIKKTGLPITEKNKYYSLIKNGKTEDVGIAGVVTGRFLTKHDIAVGRTENISYTDPPHVKEYHPLGANPGDVLHVLPGTFKGAHFAVFPELLVKFLITAGCPEYVCKKCGQPRKRITQIIREGKPRERKYAFMFREGVTLKMKHYYFTVGWTDCGCGVGFESGVVLDPFLGSGTTAAVALKMGRRFVGIEIVREYCEMAARRIEPYLGIKRIDKFFG